MHDKNCFLILLVYVYDVPIRCTSEGDIAKVKKYLHKLFTIEDIAYAKYFLGLKLLDFQTLCNQSKYTLDIREDIGLMGANQRVFPYL